MKIMIEPSAVQDARHVRGEKFIRAPEGLTSTEAAQSFEMWARVQSNPAKALRRFDRVTLVAYDESWLIEGIVAEASGSAVTLSVSKVHTLKSRLTPLFSDGTYRIVWVGTGFVVERLSDGQRMTEIFGSEGLAMNALKNLYPRRAG
jgi:hypothetical protein